MFNNQLKPFKTSSFSFNNTSFIPKKPATCSLKYQKDLWMYECPRYGLHTYSENKPEALQQIDEEFAFLYDGLIYEPDDNLTQDAIELRDLLKSDVLKVEKIQRIGDYNLQLLAKSSITTIDVRDMTTQ